MRVAYFAFIGLVGSILLTGCQAPKTVHKAIDTYKILQQAPRHETAFLSCAASMGCHFSRINGIRVFDDNSTRPTPEALRDGILRLEGSVFALEHQYALSVPEGESEVVVSFYPVSKERAQQFHLIHYFIADREYKLVMYRNKSGANGSLLQVAAPGKLCVDLLENDREIRRFCRPHDVTTGLGEFLEEDV